MKQYDTQTLKKLHRFGVAMLSDFIRVCNQYHIDYFAVFGTALGAVRHKGYIPWDDDLDVGMLREDYEKFLSIFPNELGKHYRILNTSVDEEYTCTVTHFGRKGTTFVPEHAKRMKCEQNICFDIFIFDPISDDPKERKKQLFKGWFWSKLLFLRGTPYPIIPLKGILKYIAAAVCFIVHYGLVVFRVKSSFIDKKIQKNSQLFRGQKTKEIACFQDSNIAKSIMSCKEIFPTRKVPFESIEINLPNQYDAYLKRTYGDYMQLPSEENRKNHYPDQLDFGDQFDIMCRENDKNKQTES